MTAFRLPRSTKSKPQRKWRCPALRESSTSRPHPLPRRQNWKTGSHFLRSAAKDEQFRLGVALGAASQKVCPPIGYHTHPHSCSGRADCGGGSLSSAAASLQPIFLTYRGGLQLALQLAQDDASVFPRPSRRPAPRLCCYLLSGGKYRRAL